MSDPRPGRRSLLIGAALLAVAAVATLFLTRRRPSPPVPALTAQASASRVTGLPDHSKPTLLTVPEDEPEPGIIADVFAPDKVRQALAANAWVQDALHAPLGKGFLGTWAAFLDAKGSDIGGGFEGTVLDYFATQVLATPFRVVWFGGDKAPSTPAVVVPEPPVAASTAFAVLDKAVRRGVYTAARCPGPPETAKTADIRISRWLISDHPVFAGMLEQRLVLARSPIAVLAGLCTKLDAMPVKHEGDVEVSLQTPGLGREAQLMATLLGLGPSPRLSFAVEGDHLAPRGISAEIAVGGRLSGAALSDKLLKIVPADVPVMLGLQVQLPAELTAEALQAHFDPRNKKEASKPVARQFVLLWNPRGRAGPSDTALLWEHADDEPALEKAFKYPWRTVCDVPVLASEGTLMDRIQAVCAGGQPSMLHAAPAVVAGLREPSSMVLGVQLGKLLSQITADAYAVESKKTDLPPEIHEAQQLLDALPFVGLRGLANGNTLVPGGFRS